MQSGAIRRILEIKKKDWTKKLLMFDKKIREMTTF